MDRRSFLKVAGAAVVTPAVGGLLAACGGSDTSTTTSGTSPAGGGSSGGSSGTSRRVKLGFIALTDCASIVMAKELGYFAERDLDVSVEKQASWPATRDNLLNNQIDGGHVLFSMPFSVATGIGLAAGSAQSQALKIAMTLNNNGQAITLNKAFAEVGYALDPGSLEKVKAVLEAKSPELAMTFPGGTHDTWLRYWLQAAKVDISKLSIKPVPPPNMVANMEANAVDGYCVGEPWNAVAVKKGIGFTHLTTQDIWKHHPEKALVVTEKFATERPEVLKDVMGAVLKASQWLDNLGNRKQAATTIGAEGYVNAPAAEIESRLLGIYEMGGGIPSRSYADDYMTFYRDGLVNAPRRGHAIWFMAQYRRFGLLKEDPPYQQLADSIILRDLYEEVAAAENIPVPDDDMKPFDIQLDGITFDPATPIPEATRV